MQCPCALPRAVVAARASPRLPTIGLGDLAANSLCPRTPYRLVFAVPCSPSPLGLWVAVAPPRHRAEPPGPPPLRPALPAHDCRHARHARVRLLAGPPPARPPPIRAALLSPSRSACTWPSMLVLTVVSFIACASSVRPHAARWLGLPCERAGPPHRHALPLRINASLVRQALARHAPRSRFACHRTAAMPCCAPARLLVPCVLLRAAGVAGVRQSAGGRHGAVRVSKIFPFHTPLAKPSPNFFKGFISLGCWFSRTPGDSGKSEHTIRLAVVDLPNRYVVTFSRKSIFILNVRLGTPD